MAESGFAGFPAETFAFLVGIAATNEKAWFDANRRLYEAGYVAPSRALVEALGPRLRSLSPDLRYDPKINGSIGRINRDNRFSKDKRPYKTHIGIVFWHGEKRNWDAPGFWFRLAADEVWLGVGIYDMAGDLLDSFRQSVIHPRSGKALLQAVDEVKAAGAYEIGGKSRKLMPRGFPTDGVAADYLLHESLTALVKLPAAAAQAADFVDVALEHYRAMWPLGRWLLTEVSPG